VEDLKYCDHACFNFSQDEEYLILGSH